MKKIFLLLSTCLFCIGQAVADNVLTVSDVNLPQGGEAVLEVGCEFDMEYTAFELQITLPDGVSMKLDADGYPIIEKAFDTNHVMTGNLLPSNGNYKITCRSMDNISIPTSGALFRVTVVGDGSLELGASLAASITACEFTRTADSNGENLDDLDFAIHVTEFRTVLDETSTIAPTAETNANVRVKRTIKADEWSTLCLPFAMTETQCKAAFGDDVQLAEFTGWETTAYNDADDPTDITVKFNDVSSIEANTPYIIKVSSPVSEFTVDGVDIDPDSEPTVTVGRINRGTFGSFTGSYVPTTIDEECLFLSDNKFWYSTGKTNMKGYRAYFYFQDVLAAYYEVSPARIGMVFTDETETGISEITAKRHGENNRYYNLKGQMVDNPSNGLYIKNGKKIVFK